LNFFAYWLSYKFYLEAGHLIGSLVNDWYLTTNMLELLNLGDGLKFKMLVVLRHFLSFC